MQSSTSKTQAEGLARSMKRPSKHLSAKILILGLPIFIVVYSQHGHRYVHGWSYGHATTKAIAMAIVTAMR